MSYSFVVQAADKRAAKESVTVQFATVVSQQPSHKADAAAALLSVHAVIDILPDDPSKDVEVRVHGSLGGAWQADQTIAPIQQVTLSVSAGMAPREAIE